MKRSMLFVTLLLVLGTSLAFGDVTFYLYVDGTTDAALDIPPGDTATLWVRMHADSSEAVSGVSYDVQLPMEGWILQSRDYGTYGWYEEDGLWDGSVPGPSGTPTAINNSTYTGGAADTADFWFNTLQDPYPNTVTGWATCEVFELTVPSGTPQIPYTLVLANTHAYDFIGGEFTSSGSEFDMNVTPEPVSSALLLVGIAALAAKRRRSA